MNRVMFILPILCMFTGCATQQLAFVAKNQMRTQNDIYVTQVLENLADNLSDPTSLPHFTLLNSGVPSTNDRGTLTIGSLTFPARATLENLANQHSGTLGPIGAERAVGANWTITPVNDPDRLAAMRYLYLWINSRPIADLVDADTKLKRYLGEDFTLGHVPQGWFRCGGKHDVPDNTCQRLSRHKTHFWIHPGMEENLTLVTLSVLGVATAQPAKPREKPTQTIVWEIDPASGTKMVKVTRTLDNPDNAVPTPIPKDPIRFSKKGRAKAQGETRDFMPPLDLDSPELPASPAAPPQPLIEHLNNYSNPLISPGLLSQPSVR